MFAEGKGQLAILLGLCVCAWVACDQGGTVVPQPPAAGATLDLGDGVAATLGADGSFSIARNGTVLVGTAAGAPLFTRVADPEDPDGWHDPTVPHDDLTSSPVDPATVGASAALDASTTKAVHLVVGPQPGDTALLSLSLAADGSFLTGLGEQFDHVSATGRVTPMFLTISGDYESGTNDAHVPVPLLVSSRGWGLFVASREAGAFDVAATDPSTIEVTFEGRTLDVWLFVDPDPLAIVARFDRLAGLPRPLPRWALSPIHWRHWSSADDVLTIAREYRRRHIPSSALWFDDGWQTALNTFVMSPDVFGDVPAMMAQIAALGFRTMAWTTPYLEKPTGTPTDEAQQLYDEANAKGWFVEDGEGNVYVSPATPIKSGAGIVDFTNPGARAFWETLVKRATATGIHGFKCDYGEELIPALLHERNDVRFADGTTARTARLFPIEEHATYHAQLDAAFPGDDALIVRASSWGGATQADIVWPGDLDSGFEHRGDPLAGGGRAVGGLPAAVVAAETLAASGFPAFGSDTAGYRGQPTRESMLRWMEHTALSIVMQVYEDGARLPWAVDEGVAAEYAAMAGLHQQLEPYDAMLMRDARLVGTPTLRPLPLAYPQDPGAPAHADDEYLLGPDLLVAPVIAAGASSRAVHLPPGRWVQWWSDRIFDGPADVTVPAPLGQPPLFARAGGLVPMLPAGIDTLVEASAPGVVTLASRAGEMQARAWAMGPSSVVLDDASRIDVTDDAQGVTVTWAPGATARQLTIDVDLRERTGSNGTPSTVETVSGTPLGSGSVDAASGHATLRFVAAGSARIH